MTTHANECYLLYPHNRTICFIFADVQDLSAKLRLMEGGGEAPVEPVSSDHHIYCNIGKDALLGK